MKLEFKQINRTSEFLMNLKLQKSYRIDTKSFGISQLNLSNSLSEGLNLLEIFNKYRQTNTIKAILKGDK